MKRTKSEYEIQQSNKAKDLIKNSNIFNGDFGGKLFPTDNGLRAKQDFLLNCRNNLHNYMVQDVIEYFIKNEITFWKTGIQGIDEYNMPTGHTLSSQVSCINHLFPFRKEKKAVEDLFRLKDAETIDDGYITFEFVNKNEKYLNERAETRGKNCTSIDAFVKINNIGIGIEWKYTETDYDTSKAQKYWQKTFNIRYKPLLENSNIIENMSLISCQMYYELMRQTLLLEQMVAHNEINDYKNIVVCPKGNIQLFKCCENWKNNLKNPSKFDVIDPKVFLSNVDKEKFEELLQYLETRYW